ncbi:hypothetical protein HLB23_24370 [Nocardia uniformis]|uniref:Uncharacterized protein n=1 Tax=Nocardia uniformis TaxID=53432 RepID=A0A849C5K2_9NOCA|nr:hypothetical protein [Nocardia uniformis]NNH72956.1 hypothetical protein [Nocardia uniformis]
MSRVSPWWTGQIGQANAINDIDGQLAAERAARHREASRLASEQAKVAQHLEQVGSRIDSVTDQISTVLEWTELRFQLLEFDEYQARKEIRKAFRTLAQNGPAVVAEVDDVPGYWMPPAALAVLPLILRERHPAAVPARRRGANPFEDVRFGLESARQRDAVRAELFNLAVGVCFDQPAFIDAAVPRLLSEPVGLGQTAAGHVAHGWRTLWKHAALGRFGPAAAEQLSGRLAALFDPAAVGEEELQAWDRAIEVFGSDGKTAPTKAETFTALRAHFAVEPDHTEALAALDDTSWRTYLQELIEEPSPAERPLVRAMEDLHLPAEQARLSAPSWGQAAGTLVTLVRSDLFDPDTPIPLRRLAFQLSAPLLRSRLAGVLVAPAPVVTAITYRTATVEVTSEGHDTEQLAAVERAIAVGYADSPSKTVGTIVFTGLTALALVMVVFGQWFVAVLFALGALIPVGKYRSDRNTAQYEAARRDQQLAEFRSALAQARAANAAQQRRLAEQYQADREALAHLIASLPADRG